MFQFPFGQEVHQLKQQDKNPKEIFVLGVYASAVHAKWVYGSKVICQALAVANEPYIFWDGNENEAKKIVDQVKIPTDLGRLLPANKNLNGPSAKVLEEHILIPLGFSRSEAWLCDLLPESRINPNQKKVIENIYNPLIQQYGLNPVTVPVEDGNFCDAERRNEIVAEILESGADKLVILNLFL
jgi:hypothetical protein